LGVEILLECPLDFSRGIWVKSIELGENSFVDSAIWVAENIPEYHSDFYCDKAKYKYVCEPGSPCELELRPENKLSGISYYEGDLSIKGTYTGKGTIVATGEVQITGDLGPSDGTGILTVVSPANIFVGSCRAECLLYAGGDLDLGAGAFVRGSIIANSLNILDDGSFSFAGNWGSAVTDTVAGCFRLLAWDEVMAD